MEVRLLDDRMLWDSWVAGCPSGNILQSYEWGEFKASFGWKVLRICIDDMRRIRGGAQLLLRPTPVGNIAYCPRGPIVDYGDERLTEALIEAMHEISRREGASFLKIEPPTEDSPAFDELMARLRFRKSEEIQPRSTIIVDLTPDLPTIQANLNIKTRYNVGLAGRRNVKIVEGRDEDIPLFYNLLQQTSQRAGFLLHSRDYYQKAWNYLKPKGMSHLLLASYEGEVIAGTMIFVMGSQAYYMYGASNGKHRNVKPSDLLQWESIKWAKSAGCTSYDMWGIPDEVGRQLHEGRQNGSGGNSGSDVEENRKAVASPLWGVYLFKRGFGGEVVRYAGSFDYVYSPVHYWLWTRALPLQRQLFGKFKKRPPSKEG